MWSDDRVTRVASNVLAASCIALVQNAPRGIPAAVFDQIRMVSSHTLALASRPALLFSMAVRLHWFLAVILFPLPRGATYASKGRLVRRVRLYVLCICVIGFAIAYIKVVYAACCGVRRASNAWTEARASHAMVDGTHTDHGFIEDLILNTFFKERQDKPRKRKA